MYTFITKDRLLGKCFIGVLFILFSSSNIYSQITEYVVFMICKKTVPFGIQ